MYRVMGLTAGQSCTQARLSSRRRDKRSQEQPFILKIRFYCYRGAGDRRPIIDHSPSAQVEMAPEQLGCMGLRAAVLALACSIPPSAPAPQTLFHPQSVPPPPPPPAFAAAPASPARLAGLQRLTLEQRAAEPAGAPPSLARPPARTPTTSPFFIPTFTPSSLHLTHPSPVRGYSPMLHSVQPALSRARAGLRARRPRVLLLCRFV